jgi:hypothetical protein
LSAWQATHDKLVAERECLIDLLHGHRPRRDARPEVAAVEERYVRLGDFASEVCNPVTEGALAPPDLLAPGAQVHCRVSNLAREALVRLGDYTPYVSRHRRVLGYCGIHGKHSVAGAHHAPAAAGEVHAAEPAPAVAGLDDGNVPHHHWLRVHVVVVPAHDQVDVRDLPRQLAVFGYAHV